MCNWPRSNSIAAIFVLTCSGLGVDDMYIVLLALRKQPGYETRHFVDAMKEVFVPITMTSVVNAGMFAIMNINDIPAIYLTAQCALISVIFLYLTVVLCFAAWCYVDMRRQANRKFDCLFCFTKNQDQEQEEQQDSEGRHYHEKSKLWASAIYDKFYKPLLLDSGSNPLTVVYAHIFIWLAAAALLAFGIWGLTAENREVGLGLEVGSSATKKSWVSFCLYLKLINTFPFVQKIFSVNRISSPKIIKLDVGLHFVQKNWRHGVSK